MERFKDRMEFTKLKNKQEGVDPDDVYSEVPYEKGFQFLWRIERQVGWFVFFISRYKKMITGNTLAGSDSFIYLEWLGWEICI